jgi:hypothetical protein
MKNYQVTKIYPEFESWKRSSLKPNGPAIKGVCGAESNGGGDSILAMKIVPPEP